MVKWWSSFQAQKREAWSWDHMQKHTHSRGRRGSCHAVVIFSLTLHRCPWSLVGATWLSPANGWWVGARAGMAPMALAASEATVPNDKIARWRPVWSILECMCMKNPASWRATEICWLTCYCSWVCSILTNMLTTQGQGCHFEYSD